MSGKSSSGSTLEAMIGAGNTEPAELRQPLEQLVSAERESRRRGQRHWTPRARSSSCWSYRARGLRSCPCSGCPAKAALEDVPQHIAAAAVVPSGRLAAGDSATWRGIKQAKEMPNQVLMARIGIHYRLVFRADEGQLEVLDLVTRESLMTTLKRLRAS